MQITGQKIKFSYLWAGDSQRQHKHIHVLIYGHLLTSKCIYCLCTFIHVYICVHKYILCQRHTCICFYARVFVYIYGYIFVVRIYLCACLLQLTLFGIQQSQRLKLLFSASSVDNIVDILKKLKPWLKDDYPLHFIDQFWSFIYYNYKSRK